MSAIPCRTCFLLCLLTTLLPPRIVAQENPYYPLPLLCRSPAQLSENQAVASAPLESAAAARGADYPARIRRLEAEQGPLSPRLAVEYEEAGVALQRAARHDEAIAAFDKAMHIRRVNGGLFTLEQLRALEGLIGSRLARGEYGEIDDLQEYLFFLHRRNFGAGEAQFLAALENYADWQVTAWSMDLDLQQGDDLPPVGLMSLHPRLASAQAMYEFLLEVEGTVHPYDLEFRQNILHKIATMFYLVRLRLQRLQEAQKVSPRATLNGQGTWTRDYGSPVVGRAYTRVAEALEKLARDLKERDGPVPVAADAWRNLADWHRVFDRTSQAGATYEAAQALAFRAGGESDAVTDAEARVPGFIALFAPELCRARN